MRIMTILGSPRKQGNTAKVLGWTEDELRAQGHEVERINVVDHPLKGCVSCYHCKQDPDTPNCAHTDEGNEFFARLMGFDGFILASPLYCWGFSSQLKAVIDRMFCLVTPLEGSNKSLVAGKRTAMIITSAGPEKDNADVMHFVFQRAMGYLQCEPKDALIVPGCTMPDAIGGDAKAGAQELARKLVG
jgi:multimeric flavodoxin WrbA